MYFRDPNSGHCGKDTNPCILDLDKWGNGANLICYELGKLVFTFEQNDEL